MHLKNSVTDVEEGIRIELGWDQIYNTGNGMGECTDQIGIVDHCRDFQFYKLQDKKRLWGDK